MIYDLGFLKRKCKSLNFLVKLQTSFHLKLTVASVNNKDVKSHFLSIFIFICLYDILPKGCLKTQQGNIRASYSIKVIIGLLSLRRNLCIITYFHGHHCVIWNSSVQCLLISVTNVLAILGRLLDLDVSKIKHSENYS